MSNKAQFDSNSLVQFEFSRQVEVDRSRDPWFIIDRLDMDVSVEHFDDCADQNDLVLSMKRNKENSVEVFYFSLDRFVSGNELEQEYKNRGLISDPYAHIQAVIDDPNFFSRLLTASQWRDPKGKLCRCTITPRHDMPGFKLCINTYNTGWLWTFLFAGIRP